HEIASFVVKKRLFPMDLCHFMRDALTKLPPQTKN
ncbi:MAG: hypothetical protein ACI89F_000701, partial [Porticoccaceae bacterium]